VIVIGFLKLQDGVTEKEYETWLRESDWPVARTNPSLRDMKVFRVEAAGPGPAALKDPPETAPARYIEILDITSLDELRADLRSPAMREVFEGFKHLVKDPVFVLVDRIL